MDDCRTPYGYHRKFSFDCSNLDNKRFKFTQSLTKTKSSSAQISLLTCIESLVTLLYHVVPLVVVGAPDHHVAGQQGHLSAGLHSHSASHTDSLSQMFGTQGSLSIHKIDVQGVGKSIPWHLTLSNLFLFNEICFKLKLLNSISASITHVSSQSMSFLNN